MAARLLLLFSITVAWGTTTVGPEETNVVRKMNKKLFQQRQTVVQGPRFFQQLPPSQGDPNMVDDPCTMDESIVKKQKGGKETRLMSVKVAMECLNALEINHGQALYTLHNLYYGVTETYSFTDIVTNSLASEETNECGYKVHPVSVDLVGHIEKELEEYRSFLPDDARHMRAFLRRTRPAYPFHASLMRVFNRLNDAHTYYQSPFNMFRVYVPVNFGSRMSSDGTRQIVYLRSTGDSRTALGELAIAHATLFEYLPVSPEYDGKTVSKINNVDALEFLKNLVTDGELAGRYQQLEQRLNANIFNSDVIVMQMSRQVIEDYTSEWTLHFEDGTVTAFKLLALYTGGDELRNKEKLNRFVHSNSAFVPFVSKEKVEHVSSSLEEEEQIRGLKLNTMKEMEDPVWDFEHLDEEMEASVSSQDKAKRASGRGSGGHMRSQQSLGFVKSNGLLFNIIDQVMVVQMPSMSPPSRFIGDTDYMYFPNFMEIQLAAKSSGVTRLLFDVSGNSGGFVASAHAMLWYTMKDKTKICAPLRKRLTKNWIEWIESFGTGFQDTVDKYLAPQGEVLVDSIDNIFTDLRSLIALVYDGMSFSQARLGNVAREDAIQRIDLKKNEIESLETDKAGKARAIIDYVRNREFIPNEFTIKEQLLPASWSCPFDPSELLSVSSPTEPDHKQWGSKPGIYTHPGIFSECKDAIDKMPSIAPDYDHDYWTEIAFVSDGTCGSACALLTQGLQTNGEGVAFTYGGLADQPLDVASFAGGNVEDYEDFWPGIAFGAKAGSLASLDTAKWSVSKKDFWVSYPIPFPTKARASFNWNMMFVEAMGDNALPRQFYLIPGRRHFNVWGRDPDTVMSLYKEIAAIESWGAIEGQFAATHGQCPLERTPFSNRRKV